MHSPRQDSDPATRTAQRFDVVIVGAGISGICSATLLRKHCPQLSFLIVDAMEAPGGTWLIHKYPGARSDSDLFTFGYDFKPWKGKPIASREEILDYLASTIEDEQLGPHIRYQHRVQSASWSSASSTWTLDLAVDDARKPVQIQAGFLWMCQGYYKFEEGYTPEWPGMDTFKGQIIHPQFWPEKLDYSGKRVVVIGSGATAITLIPSMTDKAQHVTMLQRTPSYVISVPQFDPMVRFLLKFLPDMTVYNISRARNNFITQMIFKLSRKYPNAVRKFLLKQVKMQVGPNFDMKHFTPPYNPWDQRLCAVPNGDLFKVLKKGKASVVTDQIDRFVDKGILLKSGQTLEADIIVTATGLNLRLFGGMQMSVDGKPVEMNKHISYKGLMFSDLPNFSNTLGYTNASWTLRADMTARATAKLIEYMDAHGYTHAYPHLGGEQVGEKPAWDLQAGYVLRNPHALPRSGTKRPWVVRQDYWADAVDFHFMDKIDENMTFGRVAAAARTA